MRYTSQYGALPEPMTRDREITFLQEIRDDPPNPSRIEELIKGKMRMACAIAGHFRDFDDALGIAMLALVERATQIVTRKVNIKDADHLNKYLLVSLRKRCLRGALKSRFPCGTLGILQQGLNKSRQLLPEIDEDPDISPNNKELLSKIPLHYQDSLLIEAMTLSSRDFRLVVHDRLYELMHLPCRSVPLDHLSSPSLPESDQEVWDSIKMALTSPIEQAIIDLRVQGYKYREIAKKVGYTSSRVGQRMNEIKQRYDQITNYQQYLNGRS